MSFSITTLYSKIATQKTRAILVALVVFLLPFERIPSLDVAGITIRLSQIAGLALIAVSLGPILNFYRSRPRLPRVLLPAFLFSYLISMLLANDLKRAAMVFIFTAFVASVASAIAATLTKDQLPRLEKYLFAATAVVLALGFYQYFGDVFGLPTSVTGLRELYTKSVFGFPRIQSTALEPLYYGSFLLIPYCLLLSKRLLKKAKVPVYESILLFAIAIQVALSVSRGAIMGAVASLLIIIILRLITRSLGIKQLCLTVLIIGLGAVTAYSMTLVSPKASTGKYTAEKKAESFVNQATNLSSQDDRVRNRIIALQAFKEAPILGIGPGNFNQYAIKVYPPYTNVAPVITNNETLELAAEAGLIGFMLFVLFIGWSYVLLAYNFIAKKVQEKSYLYWAPAILAYLIALAIQYQTFSTLYVMHVWVVIGLLMYLGRNNSSTIR